MPGFIIRGRWAWIASIILGGILITVGAVLVNIPTICVGGVFALFGIIFLIISLVTRGRSD